jgi:hypothetical protein
MFKSEVIIWICTNILLVIVPTVWLFFKYFEKIVNLYQNIISKIEYKKNLEAIKERIRNQKSNDISKEIEKIQENKENQIDEQNIENIDNENNTQIEEEEKENIDNEKIKEPKKDNTELINQKVEKIKFEALVLKEKGDLDNYEKKLIE